MKYLKSKLPLLIVTIYMLAVIFCICFAFNFEGAIDPLWMMVLIVLTLPWSVVSVLFAWALIHGAGLEFFAFMYLTFAGLNCFTFYWLCSLSRRKSEEGRI